MSRFALTAAYKDLSRWSRDPIAFLLWLGVPFLIGGLLTVLMSGGGKPQGVLLIADQDDSFISGVASAAFSQGELADLVRVEAVTEEAGQLRINEGDASAFLLIPQGFGDALLNDTAVSLSLQTNPSQTIMPGIIEDVLEVLLDSGFYLQQLFKEEIAAVMADSSVPADAQVAELSVAINRKLTAAGSLLFPPAFDLEIVEPPPQEPRPPIALLFLPGIVLMTVLFASNSLAADFWEERERGTLRRILSAPRITGAFVTGKALAVAAMIASLGMLTLVAGFLYHDVSMARLPVALLWVSVSGVALFAWFAFLHMLAATRRGANLLTTILLFPLMMIGGSFFPFAAMPDWLAALGRLTPNGFITDRLTREITATSGIAIDAGSWLTLVLIAASGLLLSSWRLSGRFGRSG